MAEEVNVDQQTVEQLRDILQGIPGDDLATLRAAAAAAVGAVPDSARPAVTTTALENLSEGQRQALLPTQRVTDQVWLMIVGAFALVFVLSALALCWAAYLDLANAQMLLTVVTTVAGVLAGFVGGRSAAPGANGPPSQWFRLASLQRMRLRY